MVEIKSFIKTSETRTINLADLQKTPTKYFIELDDSTQIHQLNKELDFDYLEGAIFIRHNNKTIMDFRTYDLIDQLWAYLVNVTADFLKHGLGETIFPDQPLLLKISTVLHQPNVVLLEIGTEKFVLPKKEFLLNLINAAQDFFKRMMNYFPQKCDYSYELEKITSIRNIIETMQ